MDNIEQQDEFRGFESVLFAILVGVCALVLLVIIPLMMTAYINLMAAVAEYQGVEIVGINPPHPVIRLWTQVILDPEFEGRDTILQMVCNLAIVAGFAGGFGYYTYPEYVKTKERFLTWFRLRITSRIPK